MAFPSNQKGEEMSFFSPCLVLFDYEPKQKGEGMKISEKWLQEKSACGSGVEWFKNQKELDGVKVVKALMVAEKMDWIAKQLKPAGQ